MVLRWPIKKINLIFPSACQIGLKLNKGKSKYIKMNASQAKKLFKTVKSGIIHLKG